MAITYLCIKNIKSLLYCLGYFKKNQKPAVNSSSDRFLNPQLVNIIRMNHGTEVTAGLEPGRPRDTRDNFCVLKGDFFSVPLTWCYIHLNLRWQIVWHKTKYNYSLNPKDLNKQMCLKGGIFSNQVKAFALLKNS